MILPFSKSRVLISPFSSIEARSVEVRRVSRIMSWSTINQIKSFYSKSSCSKHERLTKRFKNVSA